MKNNLFFQFSLNALKMTIFAQIIVYIQEFFFSFFKIDFFCLI